MKNINAVTIEAVQNAAIKYFRGDKARIIITGKGIEVLKNLEKTDYLIKYFDKEGNPTEKPEMTMPIPEGMTAEKVIETYIKAIGGKEKVMAVKTLKVVSNGSIQGTPLVMTIKAAATNKTSQIVSVMGNVMQKAIFDGEKGYQEMGGQRLEMDSEALQKAKAKNALFGDLDYRSGTLERIEPLEGKNAIVLKYDDAEIYYDMESGLKVKSVNTVKTPDGKEVKVPTIYSDYKEVNGIKFPHSIGQKMGPMEVTFLVQEITINQDVSEEDFN